MTTGFKSGGEGDIDQVFVSQTEMTSLFDEGRIAPSLANIKGDLSLWVWGNNLSGQLGLGDIVSRSTPTQLFSTTLWKQVVGRVNGDSVLAIKTDGTLWAWGSNTFGQLGLGNTLSRSSPVQVGLLSNWKQLYAYSYILALKTDGTLWAWGNNASGQLGLGDIVSRSSPVQVGSSTDWLSISTGSHILAIKTDGTLWAWGYNDSGQLGLGDIVSRSSPTQVGSLSNWSSVSASINNTLAIKTDGTLWAWGQNTNGELGIGSAIPKSSPVQVGSLTNWKSIGLTAASRFSIKTDGTLWAWGANSNGSLGLGDRVNRSSPVQVGSLSNWKQVLCNSYTTTLALKTDGTLWAWGYNTNGELGLGNVSNRSSPVQIGSLNTWVAIFGSGALRYF